MKNKIMAPYYHCSSTDESPHHSFCPVGDTSQCFFNQAKAKNETPKKHEEMKVCFILDDAERQLILNYILTCPHLNFWKSVFRAGIKILISPCISKYGSLCQKTNFFSRKTVDICAADVVMTHSFGSNACTTISNKHLGTVSPCLSLVLAEKDKERKQSATIPRIKIKKSGKDKDYEGGAFQKIAWQVYVAVLLLHCSYSYQYHSQSYRYLWYLKYGHNIMNSLLFFQKMKVSVSKKFSYILTQILANVQLFIAKSPIVSHSNYILLII